MSYISLYRKYRPQTFKDVVGQNVVVQILKNSIKDEKIGHAYIFSGPRGTGKTSIAKIFARAVNCLNNKYGEICNECEICKINPNENVDIIEIDAASNNGVEEIREIRNNVKIMPTKMKYKVYIIDEVHMLSNSAFNALLKTLEEPPAHVIFILATTEFNKIPITVVSRCQKFDFKKIKNDEIISRLKYILKEEKEELSDEIIEFIARNSDGGLRDAVNILDQILSFNNKNITMSDVYNLLGLYNEEKLFNLIDKIFKGNIEETINILNEYSETERNYIYLCDKLIEIINNILIYNGSDKYFTKTYEEQIRKYSKVEIDKIYEVSELLLKLDNELRKTSNQKLLMEVYLLKIVLLFKNEDVNKKIENNEEKEKILKKDTQKEENVYKKEKNDNNDIDLENVKSVRINNAFAGANKELKKEFVDRYDEINDYISQKEYTSLANLLVKSVPEVVADKNIIFTCKKDIDTNLFNINLDEIQKLLKKIYGKKYNVIALTNDEWKNIKEEYIKNIKNGVKYTYIEEINKKKKSNSVLQESLEDIFGSDYKNVE